MFVTGTLAAATTNLPELFADPCSLRAFALAWSSCTKVAEPVKLTCLAKGMVMVLSRTTIGFAATASARVRRATKDWPRNMTENAASDAGARELGSLVPRIRPFIVLRAR